MFTINVNGVRHDVDVHAETPLLWVAPRPLTCLKFRFVSSPPASATPVVVAHRYLQPFADYVGGSISRSSTTRMLLPSRGCGHIDRTRHPFAASWSALKKRQFLYAKPIPAPRSGSCPPRACL